MEEFTDQPEEMKMEDLDELSQLIWDEFSEERKQQWGQMKLAEEGQEVKSGTHEMPMPHQNGMPPDNHDPSSHDGKI